MSDTTKIDPTPDQESELVAGVSMRGVVPGLRPDEASGSMRGAVVSAPEHPAVALLREIEWSRERCPCCNRSALWPFSPVRKTVSVVRKDGGQYEWRLTCGHVRIIDDMLGGAPVGYGSELSCCECETAPAHTHAPDCRLAAILAGTTSAAPARDAVEALACLALKIDTRVLPPAQWKALRDAAERVLAGSKPDECGAVDGVFGPNVGPVCTEPKGHAGDHVAVDRAATRNGLCPGGTEVSRWANEQKPRERALSNLLAEARAQGADEEREACLHALLDLPAADADGNATDSEDAWQAILARVPEAERTATVNRIHAARAAARGDR